ncbi:MAG: hypothetical protein GY895_09515 [Phycisphaera sp.]|nr:hypothetical protein [Phycisphaera sp.]
MRRLALLRFRRGISSGFSKVFYRRYHLYRHSFPLMAIGRWLEARRG